MQKVAPNWTEKEFETVLANPDLSDEELSQLLGTRVPYAVYWIRRGIHGFHEGGDISPLSKMMLRRLESLKHSVICSKCGTTFG